MCPQQGKWPWGYHKLGDQDLCYKIIDDLMSDWDKAQAMYNEQGSGLVTIHSGEENTFVRGHILRDFGSRAVAWTNDQLQRRGLSLDGRLENGRSSFFEY